MENHVTVDRCQMQIFDIYPFLKACKETRSFKDVMNCLFFGLMTHEYEHMCYND